ncbi:O-methyltransferase bfoE [Frankliniella fusca]|uniref:O-methyltransferase bfoE n=1 Tax=Frankliniella fusca TaxID=407009 RepID=A0AAE1GVI7_9NEOP|nr:O-methyltransferase bfoE [Frankliniella fusca]
MCRGSWCQPVTQPSCASDSCKQRFKKCYLHVLIRCDFLLQTKSFRSIGIQCERSFIDYEKCKHLSETDFKFYTGITQTVFELLYDFLGGDEVCDKLKYEYKYSTPKRERFNSELTSKTKLFLTLLRLRRGIVGRDLKVLFNITEYHALRIAYTWIRFMSLQFKKLDQLMFVSSAAQNPLKPRCFEKFPNLRVIIDSTEFKIQRPKHFQQQNNTFSAYKSSNTMKFLVGISCFGGLSFLSEGFEGSISDRKLLVESGLMDYLQPEDAIMADRGFDCEDLCDEKEVNLLIPAFLDHRTHFTARELILNRSIAVSRIHVETFIGLIKQFRLVRYAIPNAMLPIASDLVRVCAYLVNFQLPFIKDEDDTEK